MHDYLKAIGFQNIKNKSELADLLKVVESEYNHELIVSYKDWADYCERQKEFGQGMGITLCGEMDKDNNFHPDYYFPYFEGTGVTTYADVVVDKRISREEYVGICEDPRVGISLIFHLINGVEFMREKKMGLEPGFSTSVTFSGLSQAGTILMPVKISEEQEKGVKEAASNRKMLLDAARNGDQTAIESLTLDDIDTYSQVSKRLVKEDIFTIINTYIMPYGIECDLYSIMGNILDVRQVENPFSGEEVYQMKLEVNEMEFDVCVPVERVLGEPKVGRRFKGTIWLQGYINF